MPYHCLFLLPYGETQKKKKKEQPETILVLLVFFQLMCSVLDGTVIQ